MNITIQQTIHGYLNGHQILAASSDLTVHEKKILLYQSDLSGSSIEEGFKNYLTGYPIKATNRYAFAKSWYADEMERPGCVWTHTLLIDFSDLGKIPELDILNSFFRRPIISEYQEYEKSIIISEELLKSKLKHLGIVNLDEKKMLFEALYLDPEKTIVIPTKAPVKFDDIVLDIWSDQWPRLRRQFSFCTGALSYKKIDNQDFDLLIIPPSKLSLLQRQSKNIIVLDKESNISSDIFSVYIKFSKLSIRNFLWSYGADIEGSRKNFIPLLTIFVALHDEKITLAKIANQLSLFFPSTNDARNFKNKIFGAGSILRSRFSEKEIVEFLLTTENITSLDDARISIEGRLKDLIQKNEIPLSDFLNVLKNAKPDRVSNQIWENIDFTNLDVIELLETNHWLIEILLQKDSELIYSTRTWKLDLELQELLFEKLFNTLEYIELPRLIVAILNAESEIVFELAKRQLTQTVYISLEWLNSENTDKCLITAWSREIANRHYELLRNWIISNKYHLHARMFALLFAYLPLETIRNFGFTYEVWIKGYNDLKNNNYQTSQVFLSCFLLSLGFDNRIDGSMYLVCESFHDVFSYAASSQLNQNVWNLIPKEKNSDDFDDHSIVESISFFFRLSNPNQKYYVEDWDYCEILIRTLVNKFIKYSWSRQIFLNTLKNTQAFRRALEYCSSFKKGRKFLYYIKSDYKNGIIKGAPFQVQILSKYELE